ncbi:hypothetical protein PAXRUDRAFT_27125 [Paxillus rubicundulus Ve08.2h10]|uniref:Uncharacterized protein n=1 Tax=Paxillus rubicundulus Ve08.2h10 TaxID=930991 RepID=A0A0D0DSL9_9AGAM|nr:hypothetical protein PAXRUDRAFT_27125 [Paxillus rubicundulus Ve08.2h10]
MFDSSVTMPDIFGMGLPHVPEHPASSLSGAAIVLQPNTAPFGSLNLHQLDVSQPCPCTPEIMHHELPSYDGIPLDHELASYMDLFSLNSDHPADSLGVLNYNASRTITGDASQGILHVLSLGNDIQLTNENEAFMHLIMSVARAENRMGNTELAHSVEEAVHPEPSVSQPGPSLETSVVNATDVDDVEWEFEEEFPDESRLYNFFAVHD